MQLTLSNTKLKLFSVSTVDLYTSRTEIIWKGKNKSSIHKLNTADTLH